MSKIVVRDAERFRYLTNERAEIPCGYSAPLDFRTTRELIADRIRQQREEE